jgi:hypothetical protein
MYYTYYKQQHFSTANVFHHHYHSAALATLINSIIIHKLKGNNGDNVLNKLLHIITI